MKLSEETIRKHKRLLKELRAIVRELEEMESKFYQTGGDYHDDNRSESRDDGR